LHRLFGSVLSSDCCFGTWGQHSWSPCHSSSSRAPRDGTRWGWVVHRAGSYSHELQYLWKSPGCLPTIFYGRSVLHRHSLGVHKAAFPQHWDHSEM